jgi:hypothetical protein
MGAEQLDLFTSGPTAAGIPVRAEVPPAAETLSDEALIAALPDADLAGTQALTAEAGRRRLAAAVPALEALCGRLTGFGSVRVVPEQVAAIQGRARLGPPHPAERTKGGHGDVRIEIVRCERARLMPWQIRCA